MPPTDLLSSRVPAAGDAPTDDASALSVLVPEPYVHIGDEAIYNPLTDRTLPASDPDDAVLRAVLAGAQPIDALDAAVRARFVADGWLVDRRGNLDARYLLKYVSLEAHTVCNQACYFCPVSINPRQNHFMPTEQYRSILAQLAPYRETIEGVVMISYNEPTIDPRFVEQVAMIKSYGLEPAVLSNGSGLTPEKTDALLELGGLKFLSINISTVDRARYRRDRGKDHLPQVLRNLDYVKDKPMAPTMDMVVLGTGDAQHKEDYAAICERYGDSQFEVKYFEVMDRAGYLDVGRKIDHRGKQLAGCELIGSRPLQHLHITPHGKCVLCCQDYDEYHIIGDLATQTVDEVLTSPAMQLLRRWTYGLEEAPDDFICRSCEFALVREPDETVVDRAAEPGSARVVAGVPADVHTPTVGNT
ncbi:MAG: radical SAM/SPASM domain-containing protein [Acidobacteriota bacterium]